MRLDIATDWRGEPAAEGGSVTLRDDGDLVLSVDAPFHDDPAPDGAPGVTEGLWNHEVVEVFIAGPAGYVEIELGPHGHQLVLVLTGVREATDQRPELVFDASIAGDRWTGEARVPRALLPEGPHRLNAFAIFGASQRTYLAWSPLPGPQPDFHQPDRFPVVSLP